MMYRLGLRAFTWTLYSLLVVARTFVPIGRNPGKPVTILLTGTFYTEQWLATHLRPLALSPGVAHVTMVASRPVPDMENVTAVYPSARMQKLLGEVASRSLVFIMTALRGDHDVIGGFHLLLNGMFAAILARLLQRRSMYFCGGGPREVLGGGYTTENRLYGRLDAPDPRIEKLLLKFVQHINLTVCMGTSAVQFFREQGVTSPMVIVPGGFPTQEFFPASGDAEYDFVLVGRLSEVKQVDVFLDAIARVASKHPEVRALVVGDGPDKNALEAQADALALDEQVTFAGWQEDVASWLRRAKVFVLTSSSEGLSQALLQAMMCGLAAVVSNVGDLGDVVVDGQNGYLVDNIDAETFAACFQQLLEDAELLAQFRAAALESTLVYHVDEVADAWAPILAAHLNQEPGSLES